MSYSNLVINCPVKKSRETKETQAPKSRKKNWVFWLKKNKLSRLSKSKQRNQTVIKRQNAEKRLKLGSKFGYANSGDDEKRSPKQSTDKR